MAQFDVFNGDADGIFSLLQLRRHTPLSSTLITGTKRDIELLKRAEAKAGDSVDVLDVSLDRNRDELQRLLSNGVSIRYWDHHYSGELPQHRFFNSFIDMDSSVCTSFLMDRFVGGAYREWALVGAYGDNLSSIAEAMGLECGFKPQQLALLRELGVLVNYNSYGRNIADLHLHPAELYLQLTGYQSALEVFEDKDSLIPRLQEGMISDISFAESIALDVATESVIAVVLPNESSSHRVSGAFANKLAEKNPSKAVLIATEQASDVLMVSVRAPLERPIGADLLCRQFGGGGRSRAGGIDRFDASLWPLFLDQAQNYFSDNSQTFGA